MKKIIMPIACGKTHKLIEMSAETGDYIVCCSQNEASRISAIALENKLTIPFPLTYSEFLDKQYYWKGTKGFLIDNADILIQSLSKVPIHAITLTT